MTRIKYKLFLFSFLVISTSAVPAPTSPPTQKYVEIKLPVKLTSVEDIFSWVKNAMQSMASKIDVTLGSSSPPQPKETTQIMQESKMNSTVKTEPAASPKEVLPLKKEAMNPWMRSDNELFPSLFNAEAYLPLFFGENYAERFRGDEYLKYAYEMDKPTFGAPQIEQNNANSFNLNSKGVFSAKLGQKNYVDTLKSPSEVQPSSEDAPSGRIVNNPPKIPPTHVPFSIPFEAFITITREQEKEPEVMKIQPNQTELPNISSLLVPPPETSTTFRPFRTDCNKTRTHFEGQQEVEEYKPPKKPNKDDFLTFDDFDSSEERKKVKKEKSKKKESKNTAGKPQIATIGNLLKFLGRITSGVRTRAEGNGGSEKQKAKGGKQTTFEFEDELPQRPASRNETSQQQEFDDDDDEEEEGGGSLGSVADLLPLALPILEDLSDPESDADLVELIEAAIPIIGGLSEADEEEGGGGIGEILQILVPALVKIINGKDGQGSDLGALFGPIFGLLAPFIGPVLAPLIGPLIRTISNPPTEGSSLAALVTAIAGPLSTPQEPSGMSPLSIVIAGTTAALLKELKPGVPGGSDIGALISSILSGVLAGTSAGLSGPLSGSSDSGGGGGEGYAPALTAPSPSSSITVGFPGRPPPARRPPFANSPSHAASTVNIGSTVRPVYSSARPDYLHPQPTVLTPHKVPAPHPYVQHHSGPVAAATGAGGGGYLPATPAASVNPLELIGTTVKELLGAGGMLLSTLVNAVFGILGASSSSDSPQPTYGAPGPYGHASG